MSWTRASKRRVAAGVFALCSTAGPAAFAQAPSGDAAMAETLFNEAKRRMAAGDYAGACPKLAESYRLDPGGGTLTALAACHESSGKTASAWTEFLQVVSEARQSGRPDRERFAQQHIRALEPKLSKLAIAVDPALASLPGLEVSRDGTVLGQAGWGTAAPVDPGQHSVEVKATGKKPWSATVTIGPVGDVQTVTVPALDDLPAPSSAARAESASSHTEEVIPPSAEPTNPVATAAPAPQEAPAPSTGTGQRTVGLLVGGVGLVATGVGGFFGVQAISKSNEAKGLCSPGNCTNAHAVTVNDQAKSSAVAADVTIGLGLAAIVTGVVVYLAAPSAQAPSASTAGLRVVPVVSERGAAVVMRARW